MTLLVDITHPAHVHFFRNALRIWQNGGHRVIVTSRDKDLTLYLLDRYGISHHQLGRAAGSTAGLTVELVTRCGALLRLVRRERPVIMTAVAGTFIAPVAALTRIPAVTFYDTEHASVSNAIAYPLSRHLVVPSCYRKAIRRDHVTYNGYHELAYLHPNYFTPDPSVRDSLGVPENRSYVIMRFVSWKAGHDIGHRGISFAMKLKAVEAFSRHAKVFITAERELPGELEPYRIPIPPEKIHDALSYATLLYGESATMASEAAVLGTPAIYLDDTGRGYTDEQERVYGAVFNFTGSADDQERSVAKGIELLTTVDVKDEWREKRIRLLNDKIDVTKYVADFILSAAGQ